MPFHRIYAPPSVFDEEQRRALAHDITKFYVDVIGLPPFYVAVAFIPVPATSFFIGGKTHTERAEEHKPFVRILVHHLGRMSRGSEEKRKTMDCLESIYKPHVADRDLSWEIQVDMPPADLWRYHGLAPPAPGSAAEAEWKSKNEAVAFEGPTAVDALNSGDYHIPLPI